MRNFLKGQSAIEYLTTYGWMLLVVAIVGGSIFTTVSNQGQIQSTSGLANADVQVSDFGVTESGFQAELRAGTSDQIENVNFTLSDPETGETVSQETAAVPVGDTETVSLNGVESSESTNTYNVKIEYDSGGLENLEETGTIAANIAINKSSTSDGSGDSTTTIVYRAASGDYSGKNYSKFKYSNPVNNPDVDKIKNNTQAGNSIQVDVSNYESAKLEYIHGPGGGLKDKDAWTYGGSASNISIDTSSITDLYMWVGNVSSGRYDGGDGGSGANGGGSSEIAIANTDQTDSDNESYLVAVGGGLGDSDSSLWWGEVEEPVVDLQGRVILMEM